MLCSITGFGAGNRHEQRAGHDVNYLGWAGVLADTAPAMPPTQIADLAAGGLSAALEVVAALLERERTGRGARSRLDDARLAPLVAHRLQGPPERLLTGGLACYRIYATADGRWLTVGALEPKFWQRLCEVVGRPELAERQFDPDQEAVAAELAEAIAARPLAEWLELMDGEDVSAGPVWTIEEAAAEFGFEPAAARARARRAHRGLARRPAIGLAQRRKRPQVAAAARPPRAWRPSRSIRNARMPSATRALDVVLDRVADHRRLRGLDPEQVERGPEDRLGAASSSRARAKRSRSRRPARDGRRSPRSRGRRSRRGRASARARAARRAPAARRRRGRSSPSAPRAGSSRPRARASRVGVAAHAADDPLREGEPELLVVAQLGVTLERLDARRPAPPRSGPGRGRGRSARPGAGSPRARDRARAWRA